VPASTGTSIGGPHLPVPITVIALSRVVPVQARLTRSGAGPDLSCDECFELLDAYAGLELARGAADAEMPLMRAHLRGWLACRDDYQSLPALLLEP
jgi:hypothetical protein